MNRWNIPSNLEEEIILRDQECVYCGCKFSDNSKKTTATWEHITNDMRIITRENIARCCSSCNASKGSKLLSDWLDSKYCKTKGINSLSVAHVIQEALSKPPALDRIIEIKSDSKKVCNYISEYKNKYSEEITDELKSSIDHLVSLIKLGVN